MKIGFYPMVADVLHAGHIVALEEARRNCDYLIVGLHCCPNYKKPVETIYERYVQLKAVKYVDEIIPYQDVNDVINVMQSLNFQIYFLGEDHLNEEWEGKSTIEALGKEVYYLSRKHNLSSSNVKARIIEKNKEANK